MEFKQYPYADVSTGFLPQSDHELLLDRDAPHHLATNDEFYGAFFYTLSEVEPESVAAFSRKAHEFGLSDRFVKIIVEASRQKLQMVRFDCDGDMIEGLELIECQEEL